MSAIKFLVPVDGVSIRVHAARGLMADRCEGLHSFAVDSAFASAELAEACAMTNKLLDNGMTWSDLVTFRKGAGVMAALIEAAHNRLVELQWAERGDGNAA